MIIDSFNLALKSELREFYDGGKNACLLNMLATSADEKGNFSEEIKTGFEQFEYCFTTLEKEAGASDPRQISSSKIDNVTSRQPSLL